jgi:hypothetical protein
MSKAGGPRGWRGRFADLVTAIRENPLYAGTAAGVALVALVVLIVASLVGGGGDEGPKGFATIRNVGTSWIAGQSSLIAYDQYSAIAGRANALGESRQSAFWEGQLKYDQDQVEARKRAAAAARRRYLAAIAAAKRAYELEVKRAEAERKRKLAQQKREREALLRRLREKYKVEPGQECSLPEVRAQFDCATGYPF